MQDEMCLPDTLTNVRVSCHYSHFTDEETETQEVEVTCPGPSSSPDTDWDAFEREHLGRQAADLTDTCPHLPTLAPVPSGTRGYLDPNCRSSGLVWWHQMPDWTTQGSLQFWIESPLFCRYHTLQLSDGGWEKDRSPLPSDPRRKCESSDTLVAPILNIPTLRQWAGFYPISGHEGWLCPGGSTLWPDRSQTHSHNWISAFTAPKDLLTIPSSPSPSTPSFCFLPSPQFSPFLSQGKQDPTWKYIYIYYLAFHICTSQNTHLTATSGP